MLANSRDKIAITLMGNIERPRNLFEMLIRDWKARAKRPPSWWNLLVGLPVACALAFFLCSAISDWDTARREEKVPGTIIAHDPPHRSGYFYAFSVGGKRFEASSTPSRGKYTLGEAVTVYFDPLDPTRNSLIGFRDSAKGSFILAAWLSFFPIALWVAILALRRRAKRRVSPRSDP